MCVFCFFFIIAFSALILIPTVPTIPTMQYYLLPVTLPFVLSCLRYSLAFFKAVKNAGKILEKTPKQFLLTKLNSQKGLLYRPKPFQKLIFFERQLYSGDIS